MKSFAGKTAVITGAANGIGRALAGRAASAGMRVVLADIDEPALYKAAEELSAAGASVAAVVTDVSKRGDVEELARRTLAEFGEVHLVCNNAGVGAGGPAWEATWNDWEWVVGVNLWGVIHGVKVFTPLMLAQNNECHIVNTASMAGLMAGGGLAPYSVTKHAVVALSEGLYLTLQQRQALVKVSVLCPGLVHTDIANSERHRPAELQNEPVPMSREMQAGARAFRALIAQSMPAEEVAAKTFAAIEQERFYILTHPEWQATAALRAKHLASGDNPENPSPIVMSLLSKSNAS